MAIGKKLLALFAGGSAVGIGAAAAGVSSPDAIAPSAVELGDQGSSSVHLRYRTVGTSP
jgi:hypothetical protein